jgi:MscS family membrane protein
MAYRTRIRVTAAQKAEMWERCQRGESLPEWINITLFGQVLWKWVFLVLLFGLVLAVLLVVFRWSRHRPWDGPLRSYLRHLSTPLAVLVLAPLLSSFATYQINATGFVAEVPRYIAETTMGVAAVWLLWLTAIRIAEAIIASPHIKAESLDAHLIRLVARSLGTLGILVLVFKLAEDMGIPVYGLVAGAGVGGIAIALAAKNTLEYFMGVLNLFADRPVREGNICRYDEDQSGDWRAVGTVESIGLRSTRIRKFDRTLVTIPNADFAQRHILNLSRCD